MRAALAALLVVASLGAAACTEPPEDTSAHRHATSGARPAVDATGATPHATFPQSSFPESWLPPELAWDECDVAPRAECTQLEVPLDWDDPLGPTIRLALARTRATGERIGALLSNPVVVDMLAAVLSLTREARRRLRVDDEPPGPSALARVGAGALLAGGFGVSVAVTVVKYCHELIEAAGAVT